MKKILCTLFVAVFFASFMLIPASALDYNTLDGTGILTDDELESLQQLAVDIDAEYGYCAMLCFAENTEGFDSIRDFGQELYNSFCDKEYAVIFVHDLNQNLCDFFVAEDYEEYAFDSVVTDTIFDAYNAAETYYLGAVAFYNGVANALENAGFTLNEETTAEITTEEQTEAVTEDAAVSEETTQAAETVTDAPGETTVFVPVDRTLPLVVDNADLLTDEEEKTLLEKCDAFTAEFLAEIAIVTVTDLEGKSAEAYADDFYDYNGYGYGENDDGLLVIYLPGAQGKRQIHITTHGTANEQISDAEIDLILDAVIPYLINEDYATAFSVFIDEADSALTPMPAVIWLIICLGAGLAIGLLITNKMASGNYSVHKKDDAADYVRQGSLYINASNDMFIRSRVVTTPKPQKSSSSDSDSGSSHVSSSGRSHGGGGRSF